MLRRKCCIGMVAEQGEKILGYMLYDLEKSKIRLLNLAVHPSFRRQGVGWAMLHNPRMVGLGAGLLTKLSEHRRMSCVLAVRDSNLPAHLFFKACGFQAIKVLRQHYSDSGEDAYLMQYRI